MTMTQKQRTDYANALAGFLQAGFSQAMAEFLARVSAGIISGDIIEGDEAIKWQKLSGGTQAGKP